LRELCNLVVDLDDRFAFVPERAPAAFPGLRIEPPSPAGDRTLAWIDETFGGWWSSEARAGSNATAFRGDAPVGFATIDPRGMRFAWLRGLAREPGVGVFGPFGIAPALRGSGLGAILLRLALSELRARGYARALVPAVGDEALIRYYERTAGAVVGETFAPQALAGRRPRVVVMASGSGSNFQAVLDAVAAGELPIDVAGLVTNNAQARAVERARRAGVAAVVVPWNRRDESRAMYDERLLEAVGALRPDVILLLGWMHLLAEPFVRAFAHVINVHPAFLPLDPERNETVAPDGAVIPAFRGPHAVRDALEAGSPWTGATVHVVTAATDRGPVLTRKPLALRPGETEPAVMERLHPIEHELVAAAVRRWLYENASQ
jgi:phosphoribosylglycinamide formyltransferase-1